MAHVTEVGHEPELHLNHTTHNFTMLSDQTDPDYSFGFCFFAARLTFSPLSSLAWRVWTSHCSWLAGSVEFTISQKFSLAQKFMLRETTLRPG